MQDSKSPTNDEPGFEPVLIVMGDVRHDPSPEGLGEVQTVSGWEMKGKFASYVHPE